MSLDIVFNELSSTPIAPDIDSAHLRISDFVYVLRRAISFGANRVLRTNAEFHSMVLAPGYSFAQWRSDKRTDRDQFRFILGLATKAPFLEDLANPATEQRLSGMEFRCNETLAQGLGIGYLLDALTVSFASSDEWNRDEIQLQYDEIDEAGELTSNVGLVKHACRLSHVEFSRNWLRQQVQTQLIDGHDLWQHRNNLFPALIFCDNVAEQVQQLGKNDPRFHSVRKRLFELNDYDWSLGKFDPDLMPSKTTPESQATLKIYSAQRTFQCPDGIPRIFSYHGRFTPGAGRIHFYPLPASKQIIIGYIGDKLQTVNDPT